VSKTVPSLAELVTAYSSTLNKPKPDETWNSPLAPTFPLYPPPLTVNDAVVLTNVIANWVFLTTTSINSIAAVDTAFVMTASDAHAVVHVISPILYKVNFSVPEAVIILTSSANEIA
jgi:hypothetical protein